MASIEWIRIAPHSSAHTVGAEAGEVPFRRDPAAYYVRSAWSPAVDVYETPEAFVLVAELAGAQPEDVKVEVAGDRRTVPLSGWRTSRPHEVGEVGEAGERHEPCETSAPDRRASTATNRADTPSRVTCHQVEIATGRFERRLVLPRGIDPAAATATFRSGLLELVLPKARPPAPRRLRVRTARTDPSYSPDAPDRPDPSHPAQTPQPGETEA